MNTELPITCILVAAEIIRDLRKRADLGSENFGIIEPRQYISLLAKHDICRRADVNELEFGLILVEIATKCDRDCSVFDLAHVIYHHAT